MQHLARRTSPSAVARASADEVTNELRKWAAELSPPAEPRAGFLRVLATPGPTGVDDLARLLFMTRRTQREEANLLLRLIATQDLNQAEKAARSSGFRYLTDLWASNKDSASARRDKAIAEAALRGVTAFPPSLMSKVWRAIQRPLVVVDYGAGTAAVVIWRRHSQRDVEHAVRSCARPKVAVRAERGRIDAIQGDGQVLVSLPYSEGKDVRRALRDVWPDIQRARTRSGGGPSTRNRGPAPRTVIWVYRHLVQQFPASKLDRRHHRQTVERAIRSFWEFRGMSWTDYVELRSQFEAGRRGRNRGRNVVMSSSR
jgi:hypothetical protein